MGVRTLSAPPAHHTVAAPSVPAEASVPAVFAAIQGMIDAGRPLIYIQSAEEDRVIGVLGRIAEARRGGRVDLFIWSVTEGLQQNG